MQDIAKIPITRIVYIRPNLLKGEHNVYSLVPNIPVCIYIDQTWIYIKL